MTKTKYRTDLTPFCWKYGEQVLFWAVYYVSGKWRRIKIRTFKTEAGAYRFYNSLPVD